MYENKIICSKCQGECCKAMPGACFPNDFGSPVDFDKVKQALKSGKYAIDWWDGDAREDHNELTQSYYIRPATKDKIGRLLDPTWGGECCFLTLTGCTLPLLERPTNCQNVEPVENEDCILHGNHGKQHSAIAWIPYHEQLKQIIKELS